jgi:hypothetical protein
MRTRAVLEAWRADCSAPRTPPSPSNTASPTAGLQLPLEHLRTLRPRHWTASAILIIAVRPLRRDPVFVEPEVSVGRRVLVQNN